MATVRKVSAGGVSLHAELAGEGQGTPLIFLHGWLRSTHEWRFLFEPLATLVRCVALDLPGFGLSDIPDAAYDIPYFRDTVWAALDALGESKVRLVGHGLGGSIAAAMALQQPDRVESIVAISPTVYPSPRRGLRTELVTSGPLGRIYFEKLFHKEQLRQLLLRSHYHEPLRVTDEVMDPILAWLDRPGARAVCWKTLMTDLDTGLQDQLPSIQAPMAVIWGYNDRVHPVDVGKQIERAVEKASLKQIPNVGYQSIEDRPASVCRYLARHFNMPMPEGVWDGHPTPEEGDYES